MNRYRIIVEQRVADEELREEDRRSKPAGRYLYAAGDPEQALHRFRAEIPIVDREHFAVSIEPFTEASGL